MRESIFGEIEILFLIFSSKKNFNLTFFIALQIKY